MFLSRWRWDPKRDLKIVAKDGAHLRSDRDRCVRLPTRRSLDKRARFCSGSAKRVENRAAAELTQHRVLR